MRWPGTVVPAAMALSLLIVSIACYAQSVTIQAPGNLAIIQQTNGTADIAVTAVVDDLPSGAGVEFVLDAGAASATSATAYGSSPFQHTFAAVPVGEHTVDAYLISSTGERLGPAYHVDRVGVGEIIVALGDSITAGEDDDIATDNLSADGRVGPFTDPNTGIEYGGFEPILSDRLTTRLGYPVVVLNEGNPGSTAADTLAYIDSIVAKHPTAGTWLVAYGTNDSNAGYTPDEYKSNLVSIISTIRSSIPDAQIYAPKVFYWTNAAVPEYHRCIGEIVRALPYVHWGADFDNLFHSNHNTYAHTSSQAGTWFASDTVHHPNGLGIQKMAELWELALVDRVVLVTDGYSTVVGSVPIDGIAVNEINRIGVSSSNLLLVSALNSPAVSAPTGTIYPAVCRPYRLQLSGSDDFGGGYVKVSLFAEQGILGADGVRSWSQTWVAKDASILTTTRKTSTYDITADDLTATVRSSGQVSVVADVEPPTTTCAVSTAPGSDGWYATPPKVTLTSTDSSGRAVPTIKYSWDLAGFSNYSGALTAPIGTHLLLYYGVDESGNSGPIRFAIFRVRESPVAPVCFSLSPNSGTITTGGTADLTSVYKDDNGGSTIEIAYLMLNTKVSSAAYAFVKYDAGDNLLYLMKSDGSGWIGGYAPGSSNTIETTYCKLYCADTTVSVSSKTLTVKWKLEFATSMASLTLNAYARAQDSGGLMSSWTTMGSLTFQ